MKTCGTCTALPSTLHLCYGDFHGANQSFCVAPLCHLPLPHSASFPASAAAAAPSPPPPLLYISPPPCVPQLSPHLSITFLVEALCLSFLLHFPPCLETFHSSLSLPVPQRRPPPQRPQGPGPSYSQAAPRAPAGGTASRRRRGATASLAAILCARFRCRRVRALLRRRKRIKPPQCCIAELFTFGIPRLAFVSKSILRFVHGCVEKCGALKQSHCFQTRVTEG